MPSTSRRIRPTTRRSLAVLLLAVSLPGTLLGQDDPPSPVFDVRPPAANIEWWAPVVAGAGIASLFLVDVPVRDEIQRHKSDFKDDLADFAKTFKEPEVYVVATAVPLAAGLILDEPKVTVTGLHVAAAYGLAGGLNYVTKWAFGRSRPSDTPGDATDFDFFNGNEDSSFPSGSAAVVFSLATTLSDAIDYTPVTVLLYSGAALNSWSRLYGDRHWLSDVTLGALIGITSAKIVNGRWTVFGLRPPEIWTDGRSMSMGYTLRFQ